VLPKWIADVRKTRNISTANSLMKLICVLNELFLLGFVAQYEETTAAVLGSVPLMTINNWILMHKKLIGVNPNFARPWLSFRDGFGGLGDDKNYWLGLESVYRLTQLGSVRLRVEVHVGNAENVSDKNCHLRSAACSAAFLYLPNTYMPA